MAIKTSAVLEDAVHRIPTAELTSGAPLFEWTIPIPRSDCSAMHERIIQIELGNHQIALVAFQNGQDRAGGVPPRSGSVGRLLLLPLTWRELVMRVRSELGHSDFLEDKNIVRFGQVSIDLLSVEVSRSDRPVSLAAMQFKVLKFLVSNPRRVISRDELLNEVAMTTILVPAPLTTTFLNCGRNLSWNRCIPFTSERSAGWVTNLFPKAG